MITTTGTLQGSAAEYSRFTVAAVFAALPPRQIDSKPAGAIKRRVELPRVAASAAGAFRINFPDVEIASPVTFRVHYPNGSIAIEHEVLPDQLAKVAIQVPPATVPAVTPNPDPTTGKHVRLSGAVVDANGRGRPSRVNVSIRAVPTKGGSERTLLAALTDANGNFSGEYPRGQWREAWGVVAGAPEVRVPLPLELDRSLPRRIILPVALKASPATPAPARPTAGGAAGPSGPAPAVKAADCGCHEASTIPRQPTSEELADAPETFSADKGGRCVTFTVPNRTLEEYLYTFIVRTTDPEIKGIRLDDEQPKHIPDQILEDLLGRPLGAAGPGRTPAAAPKRERLRFDVLKNLGRAPTPSAVARASAESDMLDALEEAQTASRTVTGRAPLGASNPLDWDDEPTFYQATTIALGHLVHFKQVWKADGFSLGDLLYSLALAPGQKKQIAVVDFERREQGGRSEELLASDALAADLNRDRDILEVVNTTVDETMKGASLALTGGVAKNKGKSGGGRVMGVAGGGGGAASGAIQDANRALAASALQQLHDRTQQVASSIRSQRATVVQTVSQGETVRVETESVANYNHCHAMTMEYFEVLRHFRVEHEVANVSECLFVPLMMSPFSAAKALRWRTLLEPELLDRRLLPGFAAADRIIHEYEGADLPARRYADEAIEGLEGELSMEFSWVRPPDDDKDELIADAWRHLEPFLIAKGGLTMVAALYARYAKRERERVFREEIVPIVIAEFVDKLVVSVGGARVGAGPGQFQDAQLDASLVSRPRAGVSLRVTLRPRGTTPPIPRANIEAVVIGAPAMLANDAQTRALVKGGSIRYRSAHREDFLVRNPRIDNDLTREDAVRIDTPLNRQELRNPREEDKESSRLLVAHLNENLEYYHRTIWLGMDAARRYMLLDGVIAPGTGRSVASVVENRVIAVVGNSLVMPVAPGFQLDRSPVPLIQQYATTVPFPPVRLSLPTRGVFAEAVMGECNSCEKIDDTRFWRWEESPIPGEPPAIAPVSADSRASATPDLGARDFAGPIINLQNAPAAPDPTGLGAALSVIGTSNLFRDVTGLEGNQKNAAAALSGALGASAAASEAATKAVERAADLQLQKQLSRDANKIMTLANEAAARGEIGPKAQRAVNAAALLGSAGVPVSGAVDVAVLANDAFAPDDPASSEDPVTEEQLRAQLAAAELTAATKQEILKRVDLLKGRRDKVELLKRALDVVADGRGMNALLSAPNAIVRRAFPRSTPKTDALALLDAFSVLRSNGVRLSLDERPDARIPRDRYDITFGVEGSAFEFLTLPGAGEVTVGLITLGSGMPTREAVQLRETGVVQMPPERVRSAVAERGIDANEFLSLVWSLAVAIEPSLDERYGGPKATEAPLDLCHRRVDINPATEAFASFGLDPAVGKTAKPVGTLVAIGTLPILTSDIPVVPGKGSKVIGDPRVAFIGSSTFYETAAANGEFFAGVIAEVLERARAEGPSFRLVIQGLERVDQIRQVTLKNSEQGGIVFGDFEGLSRIAEDDVGVLIYSGDFSPPALDRTLMTPEQRVAYDALLEVILGTQPQISAGRERFVTMWREGVGIIPSVICARASRQDLMDAVKDTIDGMKEGQVFVFTYLGHTYQDFSGDGRLLGLLPATGDYVGPDDFQALADYASAAGVHFIAIMETCQSGGYCNRFAGGQIAKLKLRGKSTARLEAIQQLQTGLEDIFACFWRMLVNENQVPARVVEEHSAWLQKALPAGTDAAIPTLPVFDTSGLLEPLGSNLIRDLAAMDRAVHGFLVSRKTLTDATGKLPPQIERVFNSPLFKGTIAIQVGHGEQGQADEILGPIADDLSAAMQIELKAVLGVSNR